MGTITKSILCIFSLFVTLSATSQKEMTVDALKQLVAASPEPVHVYFSAMWCLPCVKKLKQVSDSLRTNCVSTGNNYIVFDRLAFSREKLRQLNPDGFDSSHIFLIPAKYNSKKFIQINESKKVLQRYLTDIGRSFLIRDNGIRFWFNNMFIIKNQNEIEYQDVRFQDR